MNISDIIQLVVFCALIFFPLGYYARHSLRRIRDTYQNGVWQTSLCQTSRNTDTGNTRQGRPKT